MHPTSFYGCIAISIHCHVVHPKGHVFTVNGVLFHSNMGTFSACTTYVVKRTMTLCVSILGECYIGALHRARCYK